MFYLVELHNSVLHGKVARAMSTPAPGTLTRTGYTHDLSQKAEKATVTLMQG